MRNPFKSRAQAAYLLGSNSPLSAAQKREWSKSTNYATLPRRKHNPTSPKPHAFTLEQIKRGYHLARQLYLASVKAGVTCKPREYANLMFRVPGINSTSAANAMLEAVLWWQKNKVKR
jgi:hypothetical protein